MTATLRFLIAEGLTFTNYYYLLWPPLQTIYFNAF